MFIATLLAIKLKTIQTWFSGWMVKLTVAHPRHGCYSGMNRNPLLIHTTTQLVCKWIILSEKSQSQKVILYDSICLNRRDGDQVSSCQRVEGRELAMAINEGYSWWNLCVLTMLLAAQIYICEKLHRTKYTHIYTPTLSVCKTGEICMRLDCISVSFLVVIFTIVMQNVTASTGLRLYKSFFLLFLTYESIITSKYKVKNSSK